MDPGSTRNIRVSHYFLKEITFLINIMKLNNVETTTTKSKNNLLYYTPFVLHTRPTLFLVNQLDKKFPVLCVMILILLHTTGQISYGYKYKEIDG